MTTEKRLDNGKTAMMLGITGGVMGITSAALVFSVVGFAWMMQLEDISNSLMSIYAMLISVMGIIGGALAKSKPFPAAFLLLIAGFGGFWFISYYYIFAGPLLIYAGLLILPVSKKQRKHKKQKKAA